MTRPSQRITLIGYRGTGKSTVARLLAESLGVAWSDADDAIERQAGKSIQRIFADVGEKGFRDIEQQAIAELVRQPIGVLALGGGAVLRSANRAAIAGDLVVWLTASPETLANRLGADPVTADRRPRLTEAASDRLEIEQLLAQREPLYRECADCAVVTDGKSPQRVAAEIAALLDARPGR